MSGLELGVPIQLLLEPELSLLWFLPRLPRPRGEHREAVACCDRHDWTNPKVRESRALDHVWVGRLWRIVRYEAAETAGRVPAPREEFSVAAERNAVVRRRHNRLTSYLAVIQVRDASCSVPPRSQLPQVHPPVRHHSDALGSAAIFCFPSPSCSQEDGHRRSTSDQTWTYKHRVPCSPLTARTCP